MGDRKECVKHPPKCHLKFFKNYTLANSIAVEKFRIYAIIINKQDKYVKMHNSVLPKM